jgi:hypothetical protein
MGLPVSLDGFYMFPCEVQLGIKLLDMANHFKSLQFFAVWLFLSLIACLCTDAGLEILAFPCNQFGSQEPGSSEEIVEFACTRFKAEYPIFDKVS